MFINQLNGVAFRLQYIPISSLFKKFVFHGVRYDNIIPHAIIKDTSCNGINKIKIMVILGYLFANRVQNGGMTIKWITE